MLKSCSYIYYFPIRVSFWLSRQTSAGYLLVSSTTPLPLPYSLQGGVYKEQDLGSWQVFSGAICVVSSYKRVR